MPNSIITLTIGKAEGLVALNPGGTSNPYVTATIGAQSVTTPVQNKTVNPIFNATFTFHDCPLPSIVTLRVFNKIQYVDVEDPLGTATVTLFDLQSAEVTKVVQLGHGGNAALAQRAPNGCGSVTICYTVAPMPETQPQPPTALSKNASITSASGASTPMPLPAAINIDGSAPAAIPVAISPKDSHISTPHSNVQPAAGGAASTAFNMIASNPTTTNPAATTPKLRPVEEAGSNSIGSAAVGPAYSSSTSFGVTNAQYSQLTPPSLTPAKAPAVSSFLVPQVAPAPPTTAADLNVSLKTSPNNGYISYAVPGVKAPAPVAADDNASAAAVPAFQLPAESYYANNSASQPASTPVPAVVAPSLSSASMLPVAPSAPAAARFAPLQESINPATSFDAQHGHPAQQSASSSSLYTSAAQAPAVLPQQKLLVVPPNINGTPSPTFFHASAAPSQEGSRLPSAAQLPTSMAATADAFPAHAPPAPEAGAIPVAVAPRTQPLSSSTSNSLSSTPATLSSRGHSAVAAAPAASGGFPVHATVSAAGVVQQRGVAPAPATAGLQQPQHAAFPSPPHPTHLPVSTRSIATTAVAAGTTSPKRRSPKNEASTGAAMPSATALYDDKEYLFEVAANGSDEAIFRKLREVDPCLTNGFVSCVDYSGRSLLHIAAWNGQLRVLQILLAPEPAAPMIDLRSLIAAKSGNTILHAAACGGQVEVAQWLRYSHPFAGPLLLPMRNARGMTAAECAMEAGFPQVARLLLPN
jgi:hypothetical protein